MTPDLVITPAAVDDLENAADWYERERPGLGAEFVKEAYDRIETIRRFPSIGALILRDVRRVLIDRFPYGVYYRLLAIQVFVIAVFHQHRSPRTLRERLRA